MSENVKRPFRKYRLAAGAFETGEFYDNYKEREKYKLKVFVLHSEIFG